MARIGAGFGGHKQGASFAGAGLTGDGGVELVNRTNKAVVRLCFAFDVEILAFGGGELAEELSFLEGFGRLLTIGCLGCEPLLLYFLKELDVLCHGALNALLVEGEAAEAVGVLEEGGGLV